MSKGYFYAISRNFGFFVIFSFSSVCTVKIVLYGTFHVLHKKLTSTQVSLHSNPNIYILTFSDLVTSDDLDLIRDYQRLMRADTIHAVSWALFRPDTGNLPGEASYGIR